MISLTIAPELKAMSPPSPWAGSPPPSAIASTTNPWQEIEAAAARFRGMTMEEARKLPPIKALRDAYRALGNDPTRYRGSNEALVRRITQGKELYRVNTVVDINNLISLETLHSAGTFDLEHVSRRSSSASASRARATRALAGARSRSKGCRCLPISLARSAAPPAIRNGRWCGWRRPGS